LFAPKTSNKAWGEPLFEMRAIDRPASVVWGSVALLSAGRIFHAEHGCIPASVKSIPAVTVRLFEAGKLKLPREKFLKIDVEATLRV
jgi:hypothetical protein